MAIDRRSHHLPETRGPFWLRSARKPKGERARHQLPPDRQTSSRGSGVVRLRERYAVGLYRVSTAEQGQSGLGLEA